MKRALFPRIIALLLSILTVSALLTSCSSSEDTPKESETQPSAADFELSPDFVIVYSDLDDSALAPARKLRGAIKELYGFEPALKTDFLAKDQLPAPHEILVGETNREASKSLTEALSAKDFAYQITEFGCILITGGSEEAIGLAVDKFLADIFAYTAEGTGKAALLTPSPAVVEKYTYPVKSLTLDGISIEEYTIVYEAGSHKRAAENLASFFEDLTGIALPVEANADSNKIILGGLVGGGLPSGWRIEKAGNNIAVRAASDYIEAAVNQFLKSSLPLEPKDEVSLTLPENEMSGCFLPEEQSYQPIYRQTTDLSQICPGIVTYTRHYVDRDGLPIVAYVTEIAPGATSFVLGTANGSPSLASQQQVLSQLEAEVNLHPDYDICAAVNGSLYDWINGSIHPYGLNVKYGQILSDNDSVHYPIFAIKKDGSYFIGFDRDIDRSQIEHCVSGRYMPLRNGWFDDMYWEDPITTIRHPRTVIGITPEGRLFVVVIDGRQPGYSNGATLGDAGLIMKELGCINAINLDGGGSSITYVKNYETGEYTYRNSPCDTYDDGSFGKLRPVINSVLFLRNPDYTES